MNKTYWYRNTSFSTKSLTHSANGAANTSRRVILSLASLVLFSVFISCNRPSAPDCFKTAGEPSSRIVSLTEGVSRLEVNDLLVTNVYLSEDERVEVVGPKNLLEEISIDQEADLLRLGNNSTCDWVRDLSIRMQANVYVKSLDGITFNALADLTVHDTLRSPVFDFRSDFGKGDVHLLVDTDSLNVWVNEGLTQVFMHGEARKSGLFNQGHGVMDASDLPANVVLCNNSSINTMRVKALDYLYVEINAGGDVYYSGNPEVDSVLGGGGQLVEEF